VGDEVKKQADEKAKVLPPRVEKALAAARAAAIADRKRKGGRWLAIVPLAVAAIFLALMMPRATPPDGIPLPDIDMRTLSRVEHADDARAAAAEAKRLPADVLAIGSAFRAVNRSEVHGDDEVTRIDAKRSLDTMMRALEPRPSLDEELLSLRAVQTRRFLEGVRRWEATGESDSELDELGGMFIKSMDDAGWVRRSASARLLLLTDSQRRVVFKTFWNIAVGLEGRAPFTLTLDEQRSIYAFYIQHPHPPEAHRLGLLAQRNQATTPEACFRVNVEQARQSDTWLAEKLKRLGAIDPSYPTAYALGVVYYRAGRYDLSSEAFNAYVAAHPDGSLTLRARNHLKAALVAGL